MNKKVQLRIIELAVPILEYQKWVQIEYIKDISENDLISLLTKEFNNLNKFAKENNITQIKISVPWEWRKLKEVGFLQASGYLECYQLKLSTKSPSATVKEITDPDLIKDLIRKNAQYHHLKIPYYFRKDVEKGFEEFMTIVKNNLKENRALILGIEDKGQIIAVAESEYIDNYIEVNDLYIDEKYRGMGYGHALLNAVWDKIKERKLEKMALFTGYNLEALHFYERLGFQKKYLSWVKNI